MKKTSLQIFIALLVLGLFCGTVTAVPSIIADPQPSQNVTVTGTVGAPQAFTIPFNENATVTWNVKGENIKEENTTTQTDSNNVATLNHVLQLGSYQVTPVWAVRADSSLECRRKSSRSSNHLI